MKEGKIGPEILRAVPDDDTMGSKKSESNEQSKLLKPKFEKLEVILPSMALAGLKEESPGFYKSDSPFPSDTLINSTSYNPLFNALAPDYATTRKEELTKLLSGQVVVDLGAGENLDPYRIASFCGAKGYIAVEPGYGKKLHYMLEHHFVPEPEFAGSTLKLCPISIVQEDMRKFIQRLPKNSISIFSFGIDNNILGEMTQTDREQLRSDIAHVIHPQGAQIVDIETVIRGTSLMENKTFNGDSLSQYYILRKNDEAIK